MVLEKPRLGGKKIVVEVIVEVFLGKPIFYLWEKPIFFSGRISVSSLALIGAGRHSSLGKNPWLG